LVAVVPAWFAARFTNMNLKLVRILREPYIGTMRLFWHENYERDPGHLWMRSLIAHAANVANFEESLNDVEIITVVSEGAAANGALSKRVLGPSFTFAE
jgi:hypothetical protein